MAQDDLQTEQLRALLAVAAHGTILGAAEVLGASRATVRRRLEQLEASASTPLLERREAGLVLTAAGDLVAERSRVILRDTTAMFHAARELGRRRSVFHVLLPIGMPPRFTAGILHMVQQQFPDLQWDIQEAVDPLLQLHLLADVVFHFGDPPKGGDFYSRVVRRSRLALFATPAYLDGAGRPETLAALDDHPIACWRGTEEEPGDLLLSDGGTHRVEPRQVSANPLLLRHLAEVGAGIAYLPDGGDFDQSNMVPLEQVLPDVVSADVPLRVLIRRSTASDARVSQAIDALKSLMERVPLPG